MAKLLSTRELAAYLGVTQRTVYTLIKRGEIPYVKVGGRFRFEQERIDEWLRAKPATAKVGSQFDRIAEAANPLEKKLLFMGVLTEQLQKKGILPVVVGGSAVEFYTAGGYATGDIDIAAPTKPVDEVLKGWDFRREGRYWLNEKLGILIEAPVSFLEAEKLKKLSEIEVDELKVYMIGIEDIIVDRLSAYVHWKSQDDRLWAKELIALHWEEMDWDYLRKNAETEDVLSALETIRREIGKSEKD
jgi:excisionase family DNA binding protein